MASKNVRFKTQLLKPPLLCTCIVTITLLMGFILKLYPCGDISLILYLSPQFFFKIQNRALKIRGAFFFFRKVLQLKIK